MATTPKVPNPHPKPDLKIEMRAVGDVKPYPGNPRRNDGAVTAVASSITAFGFRQPIVVDKEGVVIVGHTRLKAAIQLGMTHVPVHVADLTPETAKAYRLADNKTNELAEWDDTLLATELAELKALDVDLVSLGWSPEELGEIFAPEPAEGLTDADEVPPTPAEPITKPGDLWILGEHRLLCGDSTSEADVMRVMAGDRAEMVWSDPPYGVAIGDKNAFLNTLAKSNRIEENLQNDDIDEPALARMLKACFAIAVRVCTPGAAWYIAAPAGPLHTTFGLALKEHGIWRQTIQWVKDTATFSPMGVDYHWRAEPIFYGWLPNAGHRYRGDRTQTTVWEIARPRKSPDHPTMKPIELVERAILNSSDKGQVVYDAFLGSGTTLIACERLGRRCRGLEIEPRYADVIVRRWEAFTGKKAECVPAGSTAGVAPTVPASNRNTPAKAGAGEGVG